MSDLAEHLRNLVVANRILAHEEVVDGYGHVSIRHPERADRFFLASSRSPELVTLDDIMEFDLECNPIDQRGRPMYIERPIHGAVYQLRPDVKAVVHNHSYELLPFSTSKVRLRPILNSAASIGVHIPVWDIREKFGDTTMLVQTREQGRDLARALDCGQVVLMRGHGSVVTGYSLHAVVQSAVYLKINAKVQTEAMKFGDNIFLSEGEVVAIQRQMREQQTALLRLWEYWALRCGAANM